MSLGEIPGFEASCGPFRDTLQGSRGTQFSSQVALLARGIYACLHHKTNPQVAAMDGARARREKVSRSQQSVRGTSFLPLLGLLLDV